MNVDDIKLPENLMENVEKRLKSHIEAKKKKRTIYASAAAVMLALIIPVSIYAYNNFIVNVPYKQEVDLARANKDMTQLNTIFKYKDVTFKIKEAVADDFGIEVVYEVSNPAYSINIFRLLDANNVQFPYNYGFYTPPGDNKHTEKAFYINISDKKALEYIKNNSITIDIRELCYNSQFNNTIKVDWPLNMKVPVHEVKTMKIDKQQQLPFGTIKYNSLKIGVLKSVLDYEFIPKDSAINGFDPIFSIRLDNEYIDTVHNNIHPTMDGKGIEFKGMYYNISKNIGIKLLGGAVSYSEKDNEYKIDKNKLPMQYDYHGDKFNISLLKEDDKTVTYEFTIDKSNRNYRYLSFFFRDPSMYEIKTADTGLIKYTDQTYRDNTYNSLVKTVPNFEAIFKDSELNIGATRQIITVQKYYSNSFKVIEGSKTYLLDLNEILVKP